MQADGWTGWMAESSSANFPGACEREINNYCHVPSQQPMPPGRSQYHHSLPSIQARQGLTCCETRHSARYRGGFKADLVHLYMLIWPICDVFQAAAVLPPEGPMSSR
ncbi:hypothetical protein V2G26_006572 [Clonostachys chloroleuca]